MVFGRKISTNDVDDSANEGATYVPDLSNSYPYLPERTMFIPYPEDLTNEFKSVSVFINRRQTRKRERLESKVRLPDDCTHVGLFMDSGKTEPGKYGLIKKVWTFVKEQRIDDDEPNHIFETEKLLHEKESPGFHDYSEREYKICFTKRTKIQGQATTYEPLLDDSNMYPYLTIWVGKSEEDYKIQQQSVVVDSESDDDSVANF
jgi:hypothetical protein